MGKLMKGDCLERLKEIPDNSVDLILTDPPYDIRNTKPGGNSALALSLRGMNDAIANAGIVSGFDRDIFVELFRVMRAPNAYFFCNKAQLPMYFDELVTARKCSFDLIKWVKTNVPPTFHGKYLSDTEYCFFARKGAHCMPASYEDASTLYSSPLNAKDKKLFNHPTIKPLPLVERLVRNSSKPGQTVLDPFMGSGTTGVACVNTKRDFIGIEMDDKYFSIAVERIKAAKEAC